MTQFDFLALFPEKFRQSTLLVDLIDRVSDKMLDKDASEIHQVGTLLEALTDTSNTATLSEDNEIKTAASSDIVIWGSGVPNLSGDMEVVRLERTLVAAQYALTRGLYDTVPVAHGIDSHIARYVPISINEASDKIDQLIQLQAPAHVPAQYLSALAALIGATLSSEDEATTDRRRLELSEAIEWYKRKGTYSALSLISLLSGVDFTIYDMYTNDYVFFSIQDWFVGDENENPSGLDQTYYKSPHFGVYVTLNHVYLAGTYEEGALQNHLWRPSLFSSASNTNFGIEAFVERTRPVNTVPHYAIYSLHPGDESGVIFTTYDGNGRVVTETIVTEWWSYSQIYFDNDETAESTMDDRWFDTGERFDSALGAFVDGIDTYRLGTADDMLSDLGESYRIITDPVLTGIITTKEIFEDRIEFNITVPKAFIQTGISQLALYNSELDQMMVMSTFPDVHKDDALDWEIKVRVYRTTDPEKYKIDTGTSEIDESVPPPNIAGIIATAGEASILLNWTASDDPDFAAYNVYRSEESGGGAGYDLIASGLTTSDLDAASENEYLDEDIVANTTYYYVVTQTDTNDEESGHSNEVSALVLPGIPDALVNLTAVLDGSDIQLDWDASVDPDFAAYNVYRSLVPGSGYVLIASGLTDSTLNASTENEYLDTDFE